MHQAGSPETHALLKGLGSLIPAERRATGWVIEIVPEREFLPCALDGRGRRACPAMPADGRLGGRGCDGGRADVGRTRYCPGDPYTAAGILWVPKTCVTWADALQITVGSVTGSGAGRAGLDPAGGAMILGLWA